MTLKQKAQSVADALKEHGIIQETDVGLVKQVVYYNLLSIRRSTLKEVKDILDVFARTNYTETVKATVQAIVRKVNYL